MKIQEFIEAAKVVYIEVASEELERSHTESSHSRLSIITGLQRREIARLGQEAPELKQEGHLFYRVIGQWESNTQFLTKNGRPKVLSYEGKNSEFMDLVQSISKDLNPYTVLFELERAKVVQKTKTGLKLSNSVYVPKDTLAGFHLLSSDANDFITAVSENIFQEGDSLPHLHVTTQYDNIPPNFQQEIQEWFLEHGKRFHEEARNYLSQFDRDINSRLPEKNTAPLESKDERIRASLTTFSRIESKESSDDS